MTVYAPDPQCRHANLPMQAVSGSAVDLDGAVAGNAVNKELSPAAEIRCKIQLGGGIRDMAAIELACSGVSCVILGTAALKDPELAAAQKPF